MAPKNPAIVEHEISERRDASRAARDGKNSQGCATVLSLSPSGARRFAVNGEDIIGEGLRCGSSASFTARMGDGRAEVEAAVAHNGIVTALAASNFKSIRGLLQPSQSEQGRAVLSHARQEARPTRSSLARPGDARRRRSKHGLAIASEPISEPTNL
ncbi:hypothetical protein L1887_61792 [Cichorium endivia]|nr:hypothetical protein L1887_61792 [Cichorium endivia]